MDGDGGCRPQVAARGQRWWQRREGGRGVERGRRDAMGGWWIAGGDRVRQRQRQRQRHGGRALPMA